MTVEDPVWSDEDQEYALVWQEQERSTCDGCGEPRAESFSPGSDDAYDVTPMRCHACAAKARRAEDFENPAGLFFTVERTKPVRSPQ